MKLSLLLLLASAGFASAQIPWPSAPTVAETMRRANDYWITNNSFGNSGWARAAYYTGNQRAFRVLGERAYHQRATGWGGVNQWRIGPEGPTHADAHCCGQTYIDLYQLDSKPVYLADIKARMDAIVASPSVSGWSWIDAFYMAAPVLARLGQLTGDTNYYEKLWLMYDDMKTRRGLFDPGASLWFRDANFFHPAAMTANGQKVFWSRGNGWVFASLARVLEQMSPEAPHYAEYVSMFQTMAPALKAIQGPDGMWRSSLADPAEFPNPETSGTAFFTYGFAWGIRHGFLPANDYTNTVLQAWQGLTNLALNAAGRIGYVQNIGAQPGAASASNTTDYGVGAFLLAASEIYLLAPDAPWLRPWAGADRTLSDPDGNGLESVTLDASPTEIYRGTAGPFTWWRGGEQIASGVTLQTNLPLGQHVFTLKTTGGDGVTYSDSVSITVNVPVVIVPQLKLHFGFEGSGTTAFDTVAGVGLNLVNFSGSPTDLHGAIGSGVNGSGRALNLTSAALQGGNGPLAFTTGNSLIDFGTVNAFTLTLWIKPTASLLVGNFPRFFSLGTNGTTDRGVGSLQLLSNGNFQPANTAAQVLINGVQSSTSDFGAFALPVGQWRFLALTYDGATLNFYGGSETNSVALLSSANFPAGGVALGNNWSLFLGNRLNTRDRAFRGWLDEVRFHLAAADAGQLEEVRVNAISPPVITASRSGSSLVLRANTHAGRSYVLESALGLSSPTAWLPLSTNSGDQGAITNVLPLNATQPTQLFRYQVR
ncbi:MAG: glycoside hydrolase family 88 protein [Akkermansiaceae bacterium]|nr:glycoside hydrolase family 88 protein [Verrucomicrobiales bacterium]